MKARKLLSVVLDLLYPPRCAFCSGGKVSKQMLLCNGCAATLPYLNGNGMKIELANLDGCYSPLEYKASVRRSILRFKFNGVYYYSETYAKIMMKCIDEYKISCDIISWAPISRRRLYLRGYDQAEKLARELAKLMNAECRPLLCKKRNNRKQSTLKSNEARRKNVAGLYECVDSAAVSGKRILLVDDIVTSGASLSECGRVLHTAEALSVQAITIARTPTGNKRLRIDKEEHKIRLY